MQKLVINSYDDFATHVGEVLGTSEWLEVSQERINQFADATLDHQWIHVDPERAKAGPFGQTIVHGYLTLSLLPYMWEQIVEVNNLKMMVNYGMDKMKFGQAVFERTKRTPRHHAAIHCQPPWHLQSGNQIYHRNQRPEETSAHRCRHLPLSFQLEKTKTEATCLPAILQTGCFVICRVHDTERHTHLLDHPLSPTHIHQHHASIKKQEIHTMKKTLLCSFATLLPLIGNAEEIHKDNEFQDPTTTKRPATSSPKATTALMQRKCSPP